MKKCALFFTGFVIILLIASLTDKSKGIKTNDNMVMEGNTDYKTFENSSTSKVAFQKE